MHCIEISPSPRPSPKTHVRNVLPGSASAPNSAAAIITALLELRWCGNMPPSPCHCKLRFHWPHKNAANDSGAT